MSLDSVLDLDVSSPVLREMRESMLRRAGRLLANRSLAEDAVQDALLAYFEDPANFQGRSSLSTYLNGMLHFKAIDQARMALRFHDRFGGLDDAEDLLHAALRDNTTPAIGHGSWCVSPDRHLESKQIVEAVGKALLSMPSRSAQVFMQCCVHEKSASEVCREFGISVANLNVILHRVRKQLKLALREHAPAV